MEIEVLMHRINRTPGWMDNVILQPFDISIPWHKKLLSMRCSLNSTYMSLRIGQVLFTSLILSLSACNFKNNETLEIPPRQVGIDTADGTQFIAIITYSAAKNSIPFVKEDSSVINDSPAKNSIELNQEDLAIVDQQINRAVRDYNDQKVNSTIDLKNYKRQYVAYINSKKQKEVWVNCFCQNSDNDEWKSKIIEVSDGGNCFFNLKIIINQKIYTEFSVNGRA